MIDKSTFTSEWIKDRSEYFKKGKNKGNSELIEKVISALYLLECLVSQEVNLIFKGGTSLVLLLEKIHRFSIDIDIILENNNGLVTAFDNIIQDNFIFTRYEEIIRKSKNGIPKAHYKFFFNSIVDDTEKYILLDILYEANPYVEVIEKAITGPFLISSGDDLRVEMPSVDCILGDKLTAFAPNTTGIPYGVDKELEIIKQLFDVSNLFDEITDVNVVSQTFNTIAENELEYREMTDLSPVDVLKDIFETSLVIAARGGYKNEEFKQLELGTKRVKSHIFSQNFIIENAVFCASKAAYVAMLMLRQKELVEKFDVSMDLTEDKIEIEGLSKYFKSIKKITPEGFFYWKKAVELSSES